MAEAPLPPNLNRARELKIEELSKHFANDDLSLEDLERRIERVYQAANVAELDAITADLRLAVAAMPTTGRPIHVADSETAVAVVEAPRARMVAFMGSTKRVGRWAVPRDMRIASIFSDTRLDLTQAALPAGGIVNLEMSAVFSSVKIIVSPGMRVVNDLRSILSDVESAADEALPGDMTSARVPVIRLTGTAFGASVVVKVRRREDVGLADFDDDD